MEGRRNEAIEYLKFKSKEGKERIHFDKTEKRMKEVSAKKEEKKKGTKSTEEDFCSISILHFSTK